MLEIKFLWDSQFPPEKTELDHSVYIDTYICVYVYVYIT